MTATDRPARMPSARLMARMLTTIGSRARSGAREQEGGRHGGLLPLPLEKVAQQCGRRGFADAADDLGAVVAGGGLEDPGAVIDAAALRVVGAENQAADAEQADGVGAHRAGLQRDDQVAVWQARAAAPGGGGAQGEDFGVGGGVVVLLRAVAGAGEDAAVGADDDGADGNFAAGGGGLGSARACCIGSANIGRL